MDSEYNGKFECIIVDDGSTDNTLAEMMRAKKDLSTRKNSVKVITFEKNKGKREGMVAGMQVARGELFVFIDSDSFIRKDALNHVVEHFMSDENVGAVSGNTLVENHDANLLTKMQSARYGISFDLFKFNRIPVKIVKSNTDNAIINSLITAFSEIIKLA